MGQPERKSGLCKLQTLWQSGTMDISKEQIEALVRYDSKTGLLFWRDRGRWVVESGLCCEQARKSFNTRCAGKPAFCNVDGDGYFFGFLLGKFYRAHRLAFMLHTGDWPKNTVDHINRIRTDNRAFNLRDATRSEQQQNRGRQKNNRSGVAGISYNKANRKWVARKTIGGVRHWVGSYTSKTEAILAKRNYAHRNHGAK